MTNDELKLEALESELDSALHHLALVLIGNHLLDDTAWWFCANHADFVLDHPNMDNAESVLTKMAARSGTSPHDGSWADWFDRVRKLKAM